MLCSSGRKFSTDPAILSLRTIPLTREKTLSRETANSLGKLSCPSTELITRYERQKNIVFSCSKIDTALVHKLSISHDVHCVQVQI